MRLRFHLISLLMLMLAANSFAQVEALLDRDSRVQLPSEKYESQKNTPYVAPTYRMTVVYRSTAVTACDSANINGTWHYSTQIVYDTIFHAIADTILVTRSCRW